MAYQTRLEPLITPPKPVEPWAVCDIETADWVNFLVIGHYSKSGFDKNMKPIESLKYFEDMKQYLYFMFSKEQHCNVVYAHFGGKFDFLFIIREAFRLREFHIDGMIPRGASLLCITFSETAVSKNGKDSLGNKLTKKQIISVNGKFTKYKTRSIQFRDSSAMLPFSLRSLCQNFHVEHPKLDIDYEKIKKVTPELISYLEHDLKGLYEVIEKYYEWPLIKKAGSAFTIAGQAMKVFTTFLKKPIYSLPDGTDEFVRKAYFGGRTEIFKPLFMGSKENLLGSWDVNSLYPTVMRENDFPNQMKEYTLKYHPNEMGFYDAEVEVPKDMYIPPLGIVFEIDGSEKFIFPTGRFKGRWSTIELEYARSLGVKIISTGEGITFNNAGPIFKDFVDSLYDIRIKAKKDSVDNVLAKLLLNSCYGRFGLRRERENVEFDEGQDDVTPLIDLDTKVKDEVIRLVTTPIYLSSSFSNVAIAAWVTSLSRIYMHKLYMKCEKNLYYTDTDSLFAQADFKDTGGLGGVKLEYNCDSACFLLPKTYVAQFSEKIFKTGMKDAEGRDIMSERKIVMKGFDRKKIQHFSPLDFFDALEGDLRRLKVTNSAKIATFKSAIRKNKFVTMLDASDRQIRSIYDKRKIFKTADGKYDTKPLHIVDGEIFNG